MGGRGVHWWFLAGERLKQQDRDRAEPGSGWDLRAVDLIHDGDPHMNRRRSRPDGQSLVEFALVLPILLLIFMGILDFGRAVFAYNSLSNAAREGARVAIVDQTLDVDGVPKGATEAAGQAIGLGLDPSDPSDVQVSYLLPDLSGACTTRALGCVAEVTVNYEYTAITPIIGSFIGPIALSATTQLPIEFTKP